MFPNMPERFGSVAIGAGSGGVAMFALYALAGAPSKKFAPAAGLPIKCDSAGTAAAANKSDATNQMLTPTVFRVIRVIPPSVSSSYFS
jgi:hypothetical protein